jgi:hypothetical protein
MNMNALAVNALYIGSLLQKKVKQSGATGHLPALTVQ